MEYRETFGFDFPSIQTLPHFIADMNLSNQPIMNSEPENSSLAAHPKLSKGQKKRIKQQKKKAEAEKTKMEVDETVVDGVLKKTKKGKKKAAHTTNVPSTTNATVWHTSVPVQVGPSVTNLDKVLSISPPFGQVHSPIVQPPICQYSPPFLNTATNTEFMVPNVEWRSKISPYKNIPYRGCVIFDTCSLIKEPSILEEVMNRQVLAVIPYTMLYEVDGLNKYKPEVRREGQAVLKSINRQFEFENPYMQLESSEQRKINVPGFVENPNVPDDLILKCAYRVREELIALGCHNHKKRIILVTQDSDLTTKANAHQMHAYSVKKFLTILNSPPASYPVFGCPISPRIDGWNDFYETEQKTQKSKWEGLVATKAKQKRPSPITIPARSKPCAIQHVSICSSNTFTFQMNFPNSTSPKPNRPAIPLADEYDHSNASPVPLTTEKPKLLETVAEPVELTPYEEMDWS